jgi:excisionase family DNA binding protein
MGQDVLTLQEVAELLGKSTQTIRRMIKKGDLKAQRMRTAQGFQYGIYREQVQHSPSLSARETTTQAPIQSTHHLAEEQLVEAASELLTSRLDTPQEAMVTQEDIESFLENDFYVLEPQTRQTELEEFKQHLDNQHREKMLLIHILEALQVELREERAKPKSFFDRVIKKMGF